MKESSGNGLFRNLPKADRLLEHEALRDLLNHYPRPAVLTALRSVLKEAREKLRLEGHNRPIDPDGLAGRIAQRLKAEGFSLRRVVNATGIVLHTNLGRAPLSPFAARRLNELSLGYSNLECDLESGKRGHRLSHIQALLCRLTNAEAGLVVNNNAACVLLMLSSLAQGREVIISRGELIEIGGSFRIPEVMAQAGVKLIEVGTTNKTRLSDYSGAISPQTAALMRVHPSNFRIVGFHQSVSTKELSDLAHEKGVLMLEDLGSGCLVPLGPYGLPNEPTVQETLRAGADVVCFSGDKLLGGPQAGISLGKRQWIEPMAKHPLMRALRVNKLILGALEATLLSYLDPKSAMKEIPTLAMLIANPKELNEKAKRLLDSIKLCFGNSFEAGIVANEGRVGGGALPEAPLASYAVSLKAKGLKAEDLAKRLRLGTPSVQGIVREGQVLLDVRTIRPTEEDLVLMALQGALQRGGNDGD